MTADSNSPLADLPSIRECVGQSTSVKCHACSTLVSAAVHAGIMLSSGSGFCRCGPHHRQVDTRFRSSKIRLKTLSWISHRCNRCCAWNDRLLPLGLPRRPCSPRSRKLPSAVTLARARSPPRDDEFLASVARASVESDASGGEPGENKSTGESGEQVGNGASFFGTKAHGRRFVFLLDYSASMQAVDRYGRSRFQVAVDELLRTIENLNPDQEFYVVLFSYETRLMFDERPRRARSIPALGGNISLLRQWLESIQLGSGTDPRIGMIAAQKLKPDAIFLLTDGEFNGRTTQNRNLIPGNPTVERLVEIHGKPSPPIHTIAFENMETEQRLSELSNATSGSFRHFER